MIWKLAVWSVLWSAEASNCADASCELLLLQQQLSVEGVLTSSQNTGKTGSTDALADGAKLATSIDTGKDAVAAASSASSDTKNARSNESTSSSDASNASSNVTKDEAEKHKSKRNASPFEALAAGIQESQTSLSSAEELVEELEKVVEEVKSQTEEAAKEEALKEQTLAEMIKLLKDTGAIGETLLTAILEQVSKSAAIDDLLVKASGVAAADAAKIAELAKVAHSAELAYVAAVKAREEALLKQSVLTKEMSDDLEAAIVKELNATKLVKEIDLSDRHTDDKNLMTTTTVLTATAAPSATVEARSPATTKNLIIIGLLVLLGAALAALACAQQR
mmetsp:Transcript_96950/g.172561  ORF Transcript_96950/g.172561 Transcript_96950/m.172561 type:complete len:336 (+) Transcript_96950:69-1076(+)|eukprot:CAMPEP_0197656440 /NCGR_PEP_ID=MMETSP1338-20131121/41897_1 /TAXON_ID=43686 ORGANISM="Pelagodinium beii, Strain RCC1491" /NCGR_SAMPLE_ID=MMETSP1338 /ASSEMBLY_ACC=CAM_ASM_000754 /LENGTH=335 /DNA_ID=CAMNT_0043232439 /DNA_START=69 /DNA_END=1076 /DNA_ORIENTATION=+